MFFINNDLLFKLTMPEYEVPVFREKVGELRFFTCSDVENEILPFAELNSYLRENKIRICTYRGNEDIHLLRYLENYGFRFVSTYNTVKCTKKNYTEIKIKCNIDVHLASNKDFEDILALEKKVFDFSTFQIDPNINSEIAAARNVLRVKSYFSNEQQKIYIIKINKKLAGFLQFVINNNSTIADCVNGAVSSDCQGLFIGPKLYSDAFKKIFNLGMSEIIGGYSSQNVAVSKLFRACNFKIIDQQIHMRLYLKDRE